MSRFTQICLILFLHSLVFGCKQEESPLNIAYPHTDLVQRAQIVPLPNSVQATGSGFGLYSGTSITFSDPDLATLSTELSRRIQDKIGRTSVHEEDRLKTTIQLVLDDSLSNTSSQAYKLNIKNDSIQIIGQTQVGLYYGINTLLQLIPDTPNDTLYQKPLWIIPTGEINDAPQLAYRGMMLDVARHFFSVEEVKRVIDYLAKYKFNRLHLHLSDDQGWRIEIKAYPNLTALGAQSEVGGGPGGFYSQEDFKDIVAYAQAHYIQIIPEIDMPGHTNAASLSYPFLNGNGKKLAPYTGMKVGFSTFNTRQDTVYSFINNVVKEIAAMSPSPYFHIGGDESHVTKKADYIYFVQKVQDIVAQNGKQMIGWNEIAQAKLNATSVAQLWSNVDQAKQAAERGCPIILSPAAKCYLDMKYDKNSKYGLNWAGYISLKTAYDWSPESYVPGLSPTQLLGIEAPLWSETISNNAELDYLLFPRLLAYAELGWTKQSNRNFEAFVQRVAKQQRFFDQHDINYYACPEVPWTK